MKNRSSLLLLCYLWLIIKPALASTEVESSEILLKDYKTYSLARCITNNYKRMGIDFNKSALIDSTMGFIDIDEGLGFSAEKDNPLDVYIKNMTNSFYKPKQAEGDLANTNLVIYDCVTFSQSKELSNFLMGLISK